MASSGPSVEFLGKTSMVSNQIPLMMNSGEVVLATSGGQLTQLTLSTHETVQLGILEKDTSVLENTLQSQLALQRFVSNILKGMHQLYVIMILLILTDIQ